MLTESPRILVIDDDEAMLRSVERVLRTEGFGQPLLCGDPREALGMVEALPVDVILLDLVMPHRSGEDILPDLLALSPDTPVIVVTATDHVETAVRCIKAGAFDYLVKPVDFSRLIAEVSRALKQRELRLENRDLRERIEKPELRHPEAFASIVTRSPCMLATLRYVEAVAPSPEPVLIVGETGVGKELVAAALHRVSGRGGDMVSVNASGIDENAFADTLFGHARGAFTGADRDREGLILKAGDGTLFLDEIGDLGLEIQTKLLRLVQEREYFPLGSDSCLKAKCRVIAATNRDLRVQMRRGRFREDLYYRLHSHMVRVPPLRDRQEDLPLLVDQFLKEGARVLGKTAPTPPKELIVHLAAYAFPGNVRELRSMVVDAVARHERGVLALAPFHEHMDRAEGTGKSVAASVPGGDEAVVFGKVLPAAHDAMRMLIQTALRRAEGNQAAAARMIGVSRRTINRYATGKDIE